jgi:fermentation-respiration switch protein FrsA (DUF1100 family)
MRFCVHHLWLLMAISCLAACSYRVRESNVVIPRVAPPADINVLSQRLPQYRVDQHRITMPDGAELYSLRFLRSDAVATVLYFGGNGYTVGRLALDTVNTYADAPVNVVLIDHRGYGGSTGTPTIDNLMSDAIVAYDQTSSAPKLGRFPLIVHGHSLGSFMAGHVASNRRLAGVILESSVTSTEEWTAHLRSKQSAWIRLLVRKVVPDDKLAGKGNYGIVSGLDEPVLFVVGENDDVAPPRFSKALFNATPLLEGEKRLLIVPGRNHMNASKSPEFREEFSAFVMRIAPTEKRAESRQAKTQ